MCEGLRPGETLGGLRAVIESRGLDIEHQRALIENLRLELAVYRPDPDRTPAPLYPGHTWTTKHGWCGPYHIVPVTRQPYPGTGLGLPDVTVPAKKALCGEPYHGSIYERWPPAVEVCASCAQRAADSGIQAVLVPAEAL